MRAWDFKWQSMRCGPFYNGFGAASGFEGSCVFVFFGGLLGAGTFMRKNAGSGNGNLESSLTLMSDLGYNSKYNIGFCALAHGG